MLQKSFDELSINERAICKWYKRFQEDWESFENDDIVRRPRTLNTEKKRGKSQEKNS